MLIAVDASGGDYSPHEIVKGAIKAVEEHKVEVALVGKKAIIQMLARKHLKKPGLTIVEANQIIECNESPIKAIRSKLDSSIVIGIDLVKKGTADAFVSAGSTGAVMAASLLNLGRMEGVERAAIGVFINITPSAPVFLIDAGANVDCRPKHLVWFARLGSLCAREILGISSPRIGLLNNGTEEIKGNRLAQESYKLLKKTDLNFIGNVEGHDILKKTADVVVTDGFTGNIVLKTIEGMSDNWLYSLSQAGQLFSKAYQLPSRALHRDIGMDAWAKRLDYREYGGAYLLGVNGTVIIVHGRSRARAITNAIGLAKKAVEQNISERVKEASNE